MTPDPITAALAQIAAHHELISGLDAREASHFASLDGQLTQLTGLIATLGHAVHDDTAMLARFDALNRQVADLAARVAGQGTDGPDRYQPGPVHPWWKLTGTERQDAANQLRAWVEQVYRPGYGHLAATLGHCWEGHDLCLYGLDILSQLWSALYLQPSRSTALLSAQAEYQARILPALAVQLRSETTGCGHASSPQPGSYQRRTP